MKRDASWVVKLWIVASVLVLFGSIGVHHREWRGVLRDLGELSVSVSVYVGLWQCQRREAEPTA